MKINKSFVATKYVQFELGLRGINTFESPKSLHFGLLSESLQKLAITTSLMANHKTSKNNNDYNYNFWEFKVPENYGDYLICVCLEDFEGEIKTNGYFIFPKETIEKLSKNHTINIFESDISGMYNREPKINKNYYFRNWRLITDES